MREGFAQRRSEYFNTMFQDPTRPRPLRENNNSMFQDPIQLTQNSPSQFDNHDDEFQNFQTIINENDDNFNRLKNGYFALKNANERISKRNAFDKLIQNKQNTQVEPILQIEPISQVEHVEPISQEFISPNKKYIQDKISKLSIINDPIDEINKPLLLTHEQRTTNEKITPSQIDEINQPQLIVEPKIEEAQNEENVLPSDEEEDNIDIRKISTENLRLHIKRLKKRIDSFDNINKLSVLTPQDIRSIASSLKLPFTYNGPNNKKIQQDLN
jgi:hypothetical protein